MTTHLRRTIALTAVLATAACGHAHRHSGEDCRPEMTPVAGQQIRGCLTATDQTSDGTTIAVDEVEIRGAPGWIVLHPDDNGEPGPRNGVIAVRQGHSRNVVVPAVTPLTTGAYWPMLHLDAGIPDVYEFPRGPDVPVIDSQGMVMRRIQVTVR